MIANKLSFFHVFYLLGIYIEYRKGENMEKIVNNFKIEGNILKIEPYKNGLVNKTYLVETSKKKYLLQKINQFVFKNPPQVMRNIKFVTEVLKKKKERTLNIILTKTEDLIYFDVLEHEYYRMYDFLENLRTLQNPFLNEVLLEAGKIIGKFQANFIDFNPSLLTETINHFHEPIKRCEYLQEIIKENKIDTLRYQKTKPLCDFLIKENAKIKMVEEKIKKEIPLRITHNDTKINNIMFNDYAKAVCLIDLDTVMPGRIIYDFGDAVRSSCASLPEDSPNFDEIFLDDQKFSYFLIGYLAYVQNFITEFELKSLIDGIGIIIYECTLRFLTDYLEDDIYFKTEYSEHNLIRAHNQFSLYLSFRKKESFYQQILQHLCRHLELFTVYG